MSESYWQAVVNSGMHVPRDRPLDELTTELVAMLGHPNPRWRDDTAYPLLASWIRDGEYDDLLIGLGDGIARGLRNGLGNDGDESVLRRSFSALVLGEIINRDNNALLLSSRPIMRWGDEATSWLVREQDHRGWIHGRGWAHAIAHGADLLGALARSRHLAQMELTVMLDVIADRLLAPTKYVWRHGEIDRLAYTVIVILHRGKVPPNILEPWIARLGAGARPERRRGESPSEWPSVEAHNTSNFLRAMYVQLALGVQGLPDLRDDVELFKDPPPHRADLLLAILDQIRAESPWLFTPGSGRRTLPPGP
ncbi:DUF2785 domain-containing protein [Nocardioidaceae bacterium SCSIO 66511]|nr:DUF2785 domain-containing protein [Nocardioidaceae bacterium SCSIO 66511]